MLRGISALSSPLKMNVIIAPPSAAIVNFIVINPDSLFRCNADGPAPLTLTIAVMIRGLLLQLEGLHWVLVAVGAVVGLSPASCLLSSYLARRYPLVTDGNRD